MPLDAIVAALREHDHWEGELRQTTKDGRALQISARWAVQRDADGTPRAVLEINRDISNEKRAADELRHARDVAEQASNAKSEYLSRMSHELRTPLAAMLGFSDLLEMREPREDQLTAIDAIQRAGSHLLSLVNDVLDIARIEAGREILSLQPLDVRSILEECVGLVAQSANERQRDHQHATSTGLERDLRACRPAAPRPGDPQPAQQRHQVRARGRSRGCPRRSQGRRGGHRGHRRRGGAGRGAAGSACSSPSSGSVPSAATSRAPASVWRCHDSSAWPWAAR